MASTNKEKKERTGKYIYPTPLTQDQLTQGQHQMASANKEKKATTGKYICPAPLMQGSPPSMTQKGIKYLPACNEFLLIPEFSLSLKMDENKTLADLTKEGLPLKSFELLGSLMDITSSKLAKITNITNRTLARRKKEGRLQPMESDRLMRIALLFENAVRVLGGIEKATQWLKTPKMALGGKIPIEYADTEIGARDVEDLLGRLEHGVFS